MAKRASQPQDTIENRVYLFESLASAFVSAAADQLASSDPLLRARAMEALADLAYISCAVADSGKESARHVWARVREACAGASEDAQSGSLTPRRGG